MAVEEGAAFGRRTFECLKDSLGRERRGHREIAAGNSLAEAEEIRRDSFGLAGEHVTRPSEAGRHFIEHEERSDSVRYPASTPQKCLRLHHHPCRPLHSRLEYYRRNSVSLGDDDSL